MILTVDVDGEAALTGSLLRNRFRSRWALWRTPLNDHEIAGLPSQPVAGPFDLSLTAWWAIVGDAWRSGRDDNMNMLAAAIAFYAFLALLPFLATVAMAYALFAQPHEVMDDMRSFLSIIPGDAEMLLARRLTEVIVNARLGPLALLTAVVLAIYSGARGARSAISALNVMFWRPKRRSMWERWSLALITAVSGAGLLLLALFGIALQGYVEASLPQVGMLNYRLVGVLFWLLMALFVSAGYVLLYRFAPTGDRMPWRWLMLGAAGGASFWMIATIGFSAYVSHFSRLDVVYAAAGAVVVLQLWLYLSALSMLAGAKISAQALRYVVEAGPPDQAVTSCQAAANPSQP